MKQPKIFLPRWSEVLITIHHLDPGDRYYQKLLRHTPAAASYVREVIASLEEQGFLEIKRNSHIHRLVLTSSGNQLVYHLEEAAKLLRPDQ